MIPVIETERLRLRAPSGADAALYAAFYADAEGSRFYGGPLRADQAWQKLARDLGHWALRGFGMFVMERRADGLPCGGCGLLDIEGWPRRELSWWLMPAQRGAGLAAEASRAVIAYATQRLGWPEVQTHTRDENIAARRLIARLGGQRIARETFPDGHSRDIWRLPLAPQEARA